MTFFEFHEYSKSVEFSDELEWRRWSQLLSLTYNVNRGKNRAMSPDDFNPYTAMNAQRKGEELDKDKIEALKEEILNRNNKTNTNKNG